MSKRVKWSALRYISCKRLQTQTVLQSATLMFGLRCTGWQVAGDKLLCECSVTALREGSPLVQLKQPATQILTAVLLQQRRWDRPRGMAHFANSDKSAANICKLRQWRSWRTGRRWERVYCANAVLLRQEKDSVWCNWNSQQHTGFAREKAM